ARRENGREDDEGRALYRRDAVRARTRNRRPRALPRRGRPAANRRSLSRRQRRRRARRRRQRARDDPLTETSARRLPRYRGARRVPRRVWGFGDYVGAPTFRKPAMSGPHLDGRLSRRRLQKLIDAREVAPP